MHSGDTFRRSLEEPPPFREMEKHQEPEDKTKEKVILHQGGDFHHLDLNLLPLEKEMHNINNATNQKASGEEQEIQIALHLGKNDNYVQANESDTKIYQFHNVLPNFYLSINESLSQVVTVTRNLSGESRHFIDNFTHTVLWHDLGLYRNRSKVLVYQHDPGGYAVRDCFLSSSLSKQLIVAQAPLNSLYRKNWELMDRKQREKYEILYGSLSFGACEGRNEECSYAAMIAHPLDRLLQAYWLCNSKPNRTMCRFFRTENITSIRDFLERHGNSLFQKLLYYSRHCRLVGHDEVCIHDNNVYFVLSQEEKTEYLTDILNNVENWFSVVGIMEDLELSLNLISSVLGIDLPQCLSPKYEIPTDFFQIFHRFHHFHPLEHTLLENLRVDDVPYFIAREKLLNDPEVINWISADLDIYARFVEIFRRQVAVYDDLKRLKSVYFSPRIRIPTKSHNLTENNAIDTITTFGSFSNGNYSRNVSCSFIGNRTECTFISDKVLILDVSGNASVGVKMPLFNKTSQPETMISQIGHHGNVSESAMTSHIGRHGNTSDSAMTSHIGRHGNTSESARTSHIGRHGNTLDSAMTSHIGRHGNTSESATSLSNSWKSREKVDTVLTRERSLFEKILLENLERNRKQPIVTTHKPRHTHDYTASDQSADNESLGQTSLPSDELLEHVRGQPFAKYNVFNGKKQENPL